MEYHSRKRGYNEELTNCNKKIKTDSYVQFNQSFYIPFNSPFTQQSNKQFNNFKRSISTEDEPPQKRAKLIKQPMGNTRTIN